MSPADLAAFAHKHLEALHASSALTAAFRRMYRPMAAKVTPEKVIDTLHQAGIRFVLMGTHGIGAYRSEPRATQDVDVLVPKKEVRKAVRALQPAFSKLTVRDSSLETSFLDPATGKAVIDVMKPTQPVFRMVFRYTVQVAETHRIPDLEMALVSKFAAMVSPNRLKPKKMTDAGDFADVVTYHRTDLDLDKLRRLGESIYPGGGEEITQLVQDIWAGREIRL